MHKAYGPEKTRDIKQSLARQLDLNADLIAGYLIYAELIDGTPVVTHNCCCMGHIVWRMADKALEYDELNTLNPNFTDEHSE